MGERAQLHGAVCYSEKAVTDTYYETLYPIIKGEEEYANIMPLTGKIAEVSIKENKQLDKDFVSPKAIIEDAGIRRLKVLCIVLMIMMIISTATISTFIRVLMQRADATDHQLVQVQRTTQLEQGQDQVSVQTMNASVIQLKLDQRYDRVMIQLLNSSYSSLQMKTQDLKTRILFLSAQVAEKNATYKTQETKLFELELDSTVANNSLKFLDTRLEAIEAQQQAMNQSLMQFDLDQQYDQAMIQVLNSSNTDLLKKNHEMNTRFLLLGAQIDKINATYKAQETKLSELQMDHNDTSSSLKLLDTGFETIKAQQHAMNKSITQFDSDRQYDQAMIQSLNSSNTDLIKKINEMNTRFLLLDAQIAGINVTTKGQEAKLSELQVDYNDTRYSLKFLDTTFETIKAQQQAMNRSIMQFDLDQQYDQAMIQSLNSSNTDQLKINHEMNTRMSLLGAKIAEINVTYKAQETKLSELQRDTNDTSYSLKILDTRLETIEDGLQMNIKELNTQIFFIEAQVAEMNATYKAQDTRLETFEASDCQDILQRGIQNSGVYTIRPRGSSKNISIYCDMNPEGEGWTVIQKRYDGSVDFYNSWSEYKEGFGSPHGEHWIGNEVIHKLSSQGNYILKIILTDWDDTTKVAVYNKFHVNGEYDKYRLTIGGYSGDAGNSLSYSNGKKFSTFDNDNDGYSSNYAKTYHGAWWFYYYYYYYYSHLNGKYSRSSKVSCYHGLIWYNWHGCTYSLKATTMMIRKT